MARETLAGETLEHLGAQGILPTVCAHVLRVNGDRINSYPDGNYTIPGYIPDGIEVATIIIQGKLVSIRHSDYTDATPVTGITEGNQNRPFGVDTCDIDGRVDLINGSVRAHVENSEIIFTYQK